MLFYTDAQRSIVSIINDMSAHLGRALRALGTKRANAGIAGAAGAAQRKALRKPVRKALRKAY